MRRGPTRIVRPGRLVHVLTAVALVGLLVTGCSDSGGPSSAAEDPARPTITVTSFDFPESEILGELYGQALRSRGYPVEVVARLGTARSSKLPSNRARSTLSPAIWVPD